MPIKPGPDIYIVSCAEDKKLISALGKLGVSVMDVVRLLSINWTRTLVRLERPYWQYSLMEVAFAAVVYVIYMLAEMGWASVVRLVASKSKWLLTGTKTHSDRN